jgi:hypothetical protein
MSLTDYQIRELAKRMSIPLADVLFKDELETPLEYNKAYIINIEDSMDENGHPNDGTHWTYLQCNKYPNGKIESIYFDPYGAPPSENIKKVVKETTKQNGLPYTEVDVQSLMNNACGYYCLALGHFINASQYRSNHLYTDVNDFLSLFDDLNKSVDFKKNEYILKHFFRSSDPALRKEIEVIAPIDKITNEDEKGGIDGFRISGSDFQRIPVEIKTINK